MGTIPSELFILNLLQDPALWIRNDCAFINDAFKKFWLNLHFPEIEHDIAKVLDRLPSEIKEAVVRGVKTSRFEFRPILNVPIEFRSDKEAISLSASFYPYDANTVCIIFAALRISPKLDDKEKIAELERNISRTEQHLQLKSQEAEAFREIANLTPLNITMIELVDNDTDYVYLWTNANILKGLGSLVGKRLGEFPTFNKQFIPTIISKFKECERTGGTVEFEIVGALVNEPFLIIARHVSNKKFIYITRDISTQKQFQLELEETVKTRTAQLEGALEVKSRFLATMSHEMRTPLSGLMGNLSLLSDSGLPEHQEFISTAFVCAKQLMSVINDILDATKIDENRIEIAEESFGVRELTEDLADLLSAEANLKFLEIVPNIAPDVPYAVIGDPARIRQVLINVLSNAIKFSDHGIITLSVNFVRLTPHQCKLVLSVEDHGIGISMESQDKLFQSFVQADSSITRRYGGSGLGLMISRRLCELMGGSLTVWSEVGSGSIFTAEVAVKESKLTGQENQLLVDAVRQLKPAYKQIVIVEPNDAILEGIKRRILEWKEVIPENSVFAIRSAEELKDRLLSPDNEIVVESCFALVNVDEFEKTVAAYKKSTSLQSLSDSNSESSNSEFEMSTSPSAFEWTFKQVCLMGPTRPEDPALQFLRRPFRTRELLRLLFEDQKAIPSPFYSVNDQTWEEHVKKTNLKSRPLRVLIAEDNVINQKLIQHILKRSPFAFEKITIVDNGKKALLEAKNCRYDTVLMDVMMPEMDGLTSTTKIREEVSQENQPYIIALTASAFRDETERCTESGMNEVVVKPIDRVLLFQAIERSMDNYQPPAENSRKRART